MANRNKIQQRRLKNNTKTQREIEKDNGWKQTTKPHKNKKKYDRKRKDLE